ncbi:HAD family hydrolase [Gymnodinialimonas sp. 2305UL16-5]|uniref:HAD family hydrolase n=1 Tax=Gymnodinialimonas mytili TaxID=3126503 RepID=UPI0030A95006
MTLEALIFGGLGSLAECAELDRKSWNAAFQIHGLDWTWSWETYAGLMRAGGDRQLAARHAVALGQPCPIAPDLLDQTHQRVFASMLAQDVPLRPGVDRVLNWSARAGLKLGLVSRSEAGPVRALLQATARMRSGIAFDLAVLREDVEHLAPDPEAMLKAVADLGVGRERVVVVADTAATAQAAQGAGLTVLAFPGQLAAAEPGDFNGLPSVQVLSPEAVAGAWHRDVQSVTAAQ